MLTAHFTIPAMPCDRRTRDKTTGKQRRDTTKPPKLKLVGYYTKGARPNWTRLNEYHTWKDHVREHAPLGDALTPRPDQPVRVDVRCYFADGVHNDPENVRKGIVDALFPDGDKWVYGYHHHPLYDALNPRVEVVITLDEEVP